MNNNKLGKCLRELRGDESLRSVANRSNGELSHGYISTAEKGIGTNKAPYVPSPEKLRAFSKVYNVSYDKLMELAGYSEKTPESINNQDELDLQQMLESNIAMTYGGEELTESERQRVKDILTTVFWEKTHKERDEDVK